MKEAISIHFETASFFVCARIENSGAKYKWTSNFEFSRSFPTNGQLQVEVDSEKYKSKPNNM